MVKAGEEREGKKVWRLDCAEERERVEMRRKTERGSHGDGID